jgi:proteasome lid subunit RPN8/RPN11
MDVLLFTNPKLERLFAHRINHEREVGGWLFVSSEPDFWPGKYSRRAIQKAFGIKAPWFINNYIFAPNEADKPEGNYRAWDWKKGFDLAWHNHEFGLALHFHSHPNHNPVPSVADWAFAGAYCEWSPGSSWFAVVTPRPQFGIYPYRIDFEPGMPDKSDGRPDGVFLSWRSKKVRQLVAGM